MSVERGHLAPQRSGSPVRADRESDLAELLRRDSKSAALLLYEHFGDEVRRLVGRLLGSDPDHPDIVQQVFFKVLRHGSRLRDPSRLRPWIRSISINAVYEELRRREVRRLLIRDLEEPESHGDLTRELEARDLLVRTRELVAKLPSKQRVVFTQHLLEERPLHEIAKRSGISLATAKRRLAAATRRFEALLASNPELLRLQRSGREARRARSRKGKHLLPP